MKLVCSRDELLEGILITQTVPSIPILQGTFRLQGPFLVYKVHRPGNRINAGWKQRLLNRLGCTGFKAIREIVRKLPPEEVEITVNESNTAK